MDNFRQLDESELVISVQKGNELAFAELIRRYRKQVARVVIGMLGDTPEADDVGQETFIRFWNSIDSYRYEAKVSTFLTRIAINLSINELRRRKRRNAWMSSIDDVRKQSLVAVDPHNRKQIDDNEHITKALSEIDPDHRSVVILRLVQGYSTKETAELLNVPMGTVLSRLSRALEKLKIEINKLDVI